MSSEPHTGTASVHIDRPVAEVFAAVADVSRMGEWSPECTGTEWVDGATGPAVGAKFAGHNQIALYKWTTTSEVVEYEPNRVFEFLSENHTTWRYEFAETDSGTTVTESFSFLPSGGIYGLLHKIGRRDSGLTRGLKTTLRRLKRTLESAPA